jgi:hypothetical protein
MADEMKYPVTDMVTVAKELRTFLNEQLSNHYQIYYNQPHSYFPLTQALALHIPNAGSQPLALIDAMENKHKSIVNCYKELLAIVDTLEKGANLMDETDLDNANALHNADLQI